MIGWLLTGVAIVALIVAVVIDEIRMDRELARYERQREARLRLLLGDIHRR